MGRHSWTAAWKPMCSSMNQEPGMFLSYQLVPVPLCLSSANTKELWQRRPHEQLQAASLAPPRMQYQILYRRPAGASFFNTKMSLVLQPTTYMSNTLLAGPKRVRWEHQPGSLQGSDGCLPSLPTSLRRRVSLHSFLGGYGLGFQAAKGLIVFMILPTPDFPDVQKPP